ncbi:hypothetical protein Ahy_B09g098470 [Arachis hypogaea]|uniref:Zinc finger PMZ-type domain-containing protein n=1 Tax=Arachis hypogaea TaxID=3818 RepID=A0A444XRB2_ARAHY|nr:hypothetical protein Ahy_B09g098470 [Arachis hypogaea]
MPCAHACCAIFEKGDNPEDYCSNFYSPPAYVATYGKLVSLINEKNMWPKVECDTIIPPIFRVKPGRPRMVRVREPDENRSQTKLRRTASQAPTTAIGAMALTIATSQQALTLEEPAFQPPLAVASANSQQPPRASSQPLHKTKVFGVRKSGRLKLGVRKQKGTPTLHIDQSND